MKYRVLVEDNFHYMDESERYEQGSYDSAEEAIAAAKRIVDMSLAEGFKPGMTAGALYKRYMMFGDDPFIVSQDENCKFSAWDYAKAQCEALCK